MNRITSLTLLAFVLVHGYAFAQKVESRHRPFTISKMGVGYISSNQVDFHANVVVDEAPVPDGGELGDYRSELKAKLDRKRRTNHTMNKGVELGTADDPLIWTDFAANPGISGVPNDNGIAISNDGTIVSVVNSNLSVYNEEGERLDFSSLQSFSDELNIEARKFDPRAFYVPELDRFGVVYLAGSSAVETYLMVAFSTSNDPLDAWNIYALSGDVDSLNVWSDYPIISVTKGDLFVSLNLIREDEPWETGFEKSVVWQIDMASGVNGEPLNTMYFDWFIFLGKPLRNLCLVKNVDRNWEDIYLLSNRNFDESNDSLWIFHMVGTIAGGGFNMEGTLKYLPKPYGMPPNGLQKESDDLATNDARWLDAIRTANSIQFVGNTVDPDNGRAGIYHGTLENYSNLNAIQVGGDIISVDTLDLGYPGIEHFGLDGSDEEFIIGVNYSNANIHPGYGVIYSDAVEGYSNLVGVKAGEYPINFLPGTDRWGDYFGICKRYNRPGEVWVSGTYGGSSGRPRPWIAAIGHPSKSGISSNKESIEVSTFPNPTIEWVEVEFELPKAERIQWRLMDASGKLIRIIMEDKFKPGKSRFRLSLGDFPSGVYHILGQGRNGFLIEKVIKQ